MNSLNKLKLLMWKYSYLCRYYWFMSLLEITLPILLVYLLIVIGNNFIGFDPVITEISWDKPKNFYELSRNLSMKYSAILYTPDNIFTNALMTLSSLCVNMICKGMYNESKLVKVMTQSNQKQVGVVFLSTSVTTFMYKIRDENEWNTGELFLDAESYENGSPHLGDPYYTSGFIALQLAIDEAFLIFNNVPSRNYRQMFIQAFPYPRYLKTSTLRIMVPLIMSIVVIFTSLILSGPLFFSIINEKKSGIVELMKIAGIEEWLFWASRFLKSVLVSLFVYTAVTLLLKWDYNGTNSAAIHHVQISVLSTFIILYHTASLSFCFTFCALFNSVAVAVSSFSIMTFIIAYLALKVHEWRFVIFVHMSCFFPVGAFIQGFLRISYDEMLGLPVTWRSMFSNELNAADTSLGFVIVMFIVDTVLYIFLTYYISVVNPRRYGFNELLLFPLKKRGGRTSKQSDYSELKNESQFFEEPNKNTTINLIIENLQKKFGHILAVRSVNLTVYEGDTMVLLGHNGAGKTTTLSMLTGLTKPTYGKILYRGNMDLVNNMDEFRKNVGVCLQKNSLFPYLSVMNHLIFFGMLKGATRSEAIEEAKEYLKLMNMLGIASTLTSNLPINMKRKLCLSISLMGKTKFLILDELTSGIDSRSEREIWDIFREVQKNRTIILTSSRMEEAQILGNRIAIMNRGIVVCCGSVPFLKKTFGIGYQLKIIKKEASVKKSNKTTPVVKTNNPVIIDLVTRYVRGTKIENQSTSVITLTLPFSETNKFPALFKTLDMKKTIFNIADFKISSVTLEQVFLKMAGESAFDDALQTQEVYIPSEMYSVEVADDASVRLKNMNLILQQHIALVMKKNLYIMRNWITFLFRVVVITFFMVLLIQGTTKIKQTDSPLVLSVDTYPNAFFIVLKHVYGVDVNYNNAYIYYLIKMSRHVIIRNETSVVEALLAYAQENLHSYRRDVVAAADFNMMKKTLNDTVGILYNRWLCHSLPVAINVYSNVYLHHYAKNDTLNIYTINHPIKKVNMLKMEDAFFTDIQDHPPIITVWYILIAFFTIDLLGYFAKLVKIERIDGFKHIQFMSSVSPLTYWLNTLIYDSIFFWIILFLRMLIFKVFDSYGFFLFDPLHIFALVILLTFFIISGLLFIYVISFVSNSKEEAYMFFFIFNLISTFITYAYYKLETASLSGSYDSFMENILSFFKYPILLIPPFNFSLAFEKFLMAWKINYLNDALVHKDTKENNYRNMNRSKEKNYLPYLQFSSSQNPNGVLREIIFLMIDILLYGTLLYLLETKKLNIFLNFILKQQVANTSTSTDSVEVDDDIQQEHQVVTELMKKTTVDSSVLLVRGLKKVFMQIFQYPNMAVVNTSFIVKAGECFGFVGPKGAGKTTIIKMLTGEVSLTKGDAWLLSDRLSENKTKYLSKAGYCAQTDCFIKELTGKETLNLIASLRGIPQFKLENVVHEWIINLGLSAVKNNHCSTYTEGDKRKLCLAVSLIGDPNVVFLDELTAGVDPVSRRTLHDIVKQTKSSGKAIVLFSHSMQECEILCDRLTILVKGDMKCIGTKEHLKKKFAEGYSLKVRLRQLSTEDVSQDNIIEILKEAITEKFKLDNCMLKNEQANMLYCHIKNQSSWSELFQKLEDIKNNFNFIEEYMLDEMSLEEVYLAIIK